MFGVSKLSIQTSSIAKEPGDVRRNWSMCCENCHVWGDCNMGCVGQEVTRRRGAGRDVPFRTWSVFGHLPFCPSSLPFFPNGSYLNHSKWPPCVRNSAPSGPSNLKHSCISGDFTTYLSDAQILGVEGCVPAVFLPRAAALAAGAELNQHTNNRSLGKLRGVQPNSIKANIYTVFLEAAIPLFLKRLDVVI